MEMTGMDWVKEEMMVLIGPFWFLLDDASPWDDGRWDAHLVV